MISELRQAGIFLCKLSRRAQSNENDYTGSGQSECSTIVTIAKFNNWSTQLYGQGTAKMWSQRTKMYVQYV